MYVGVEWMVGWQQAEYCYIQANILLVSLHEVSY